MTKIGTFDAYWGGVGGLYVVTSNIINSTFTSYQPGLITTIDTHVSFLFNIINIMKLICRLFIPYYVGRQIES